MEHGILYGSLADNQVKQALDRAQGDPKQWTVYLVPQNGAKRTQAQNRLYRALLGQLAQAQGRTVDYWNTFLVSRFLGYEEITTEDGYTRRVLASTRELSVAQFSHFLNACLALLAENSLTNESTVNF